MMQHSKEEKAAFDDDGDSFMWIWWLGNLFTNAMWYRIYISKPYYKSWWRFFSLGLIYALINYDLWPELPGVEMSKDTLWMQALEEGLSELGILIYWLILCNFIAAVESGMWSIIHFCMPIIYLAHLHDHLYTSLDELEFPPI